MTSLSRRIMIATVALTAVSVGIAALGVWVAVRFQTTADTDLVLEDRMSRLGANLKLGHIRTPSRNPLTDTLWRIVNADTGTEVVHATSLDKSSLLEAEVRQPRDLVRAKPFWKSTDSMHRLRVLVRLIERSEIPASEPSETNTLPTPRRCEVVMAIDAASTDRNMSQLALELFILWVVSCGVAILVSSWLRRAILLPVHRLAGAIRAIEIEHLPSTVSADVPVEMEVVRERLDDLLLRLRQVLEREKGTIANIAHELRTPIAGLRTTLEFSALGDDAGGRTVASACLPTVLAMQAMIANLLILARIEAGHEKVVLVDVDLGKAIHDCWRSLSPLAARRRIVLDDAHARDEDEVVARSCPDKARMVISNLLDNAISHSPAGSTITVALDSRGPAVHLRIANPITGPAPDANSLFQAFWRHDTARGGSGLHCGLGLALCRRLMALLGGQISADTARAGVFSIDVVFPT